MLRLASVNVNGIRAAHRRGMLEWFAGRQPDVLALQEVRAPDEVARELLVPTGYAVAHAVAAAKGRAGVLVASRQAQPSSRVGLGPAEFDDAGRWVEADLDPASTGGATVTVVSAYVHSGGVGTPAQEAKYRFLDAMLERMAVLAAERDHVVVVGDLNVAHHERDLRNHKGNRGKAGFLPEERAYLDRLADLGWVDVGRALAGEVEGPYSWWTWRGQAFDNDTGWRIDYQLATPGLAALALRHEIDRAASYDTRWSDHAPVVVDYDL